MNDDELDRWLSTHNDQLDARISEKIDLEARRERVRFATASEPHDDEPGTAEAHAIWSEHVEPTGRRPRRGRVRTSGRRVRRATTRPASGRRARRSFTHLDPSEPVAGYRRTSADVTRGLAVILAVLFLLVSSTLISELDGRWGPSAPHGRDKSVIIGVPTDSSEFGMAQQAHRHGFGYDLASWLADDLDYSVTTFHGFPTLDGFGADHREMLRTGQVDMLVTPTSVTDERATDISFAGPYLVTEGGVLVRTGDTEVLTLDDLADKRVCTWRESTYREQTRRLDVSALVEEDDFSSCVGALVSGRVDAVAGDQILLEEAARVQETNDLSVLPGATFGGRQGYGIELERDDVGECDEIREGIRRFITSGAWERAFQVNISYVAGKSMHKPDPDQLAPCD